MAPGKVKLDDGSEVVGFLCEPEAIKDARDITAHGRMAGRSRRARVGPVEAGHAAGRSGFRQIDGQAVERARPSWWFAHGGERGERGEQGAQDPITTRRRARAGAKPAPRWP